LSDERFHSSCFIFTRALRLFAIVAAIRRLLRLKRAAKSDRAGIWQLSFLKEQQNKRDITKDTPRSEWSNKNERTNDFQSLICQSRFDTPRC
jgi:hypothetical protein